MSNLIGQSLGRYHILEQLGEGGMATVYKAYDTRLERHVAVKVILPQKLLAEKFIKRFDREAKALAQLSHPNIVKVIDYGEHEGLPYLVMEYIPGGTLKQKLAGKPIPWKQAIQMLTPVARALSTAHQNKIIHRDVKSSNILIAQNGEPMLSDFGIAKLLEADETLELTGTGVGVGTPEYMSPEQAQGNAVDARSDIYSLGVVLYEMVTGRKPFQAETPMAVVWKLASEPLPGPKQFVKDLPDALEGLLLKALAKKPSDRFQSMDAMAKACEDLLAGSASTRHRPPIRSVLFFGSGGLLLVVVILALVNFMQNGGTPVPSTAIPTQPAEIMTALSTQPAAVPTSIPPTQVTAIRFVEMFDGQNAVDGTAWREQNNPPCKYSLVEGALVIDNEISQMSVDCLLTVRNSVPVTSPMFKTFEARIMMGDDHNGVLANQGLYLTTDSVAGGSWWAFCGITGNQDGVSLLMDVTNYGSGKEPDLVQYGQARYNQWYKIRLEVDWQTMQINCLVDDELFAHVIPSDQLELKDARYKFNLNAWRTPGSFVSSYFDDVIISP